MIHAAICEDELSVLKYIFQCLQTEFRKYKIDIDFCCYESGEQLLADITDGRSYSLLFLDIEMPGINGIDLCRHLHEELSQSLIIFISNREELVFQSFEVRPFRFVRKNHFSEELPSLINDIKRELDSHKSHFISIEEQNSTRVCSFNINDIMYIEVIGKNCHIHTTDNEYAVKYKLSDFENLLHNYGFLLPHRSFLVNYRYIFSIQKDFIILDNKIQIPLSRKKISSIKEQFLLLTKEGL